MTVKVKPFESPGSDVTIVFCEITWCEYNGAGNCLAESIRIECASDGEVWLACPCEEEEF